MLRKREGNVERGGSEARPRLQPPSHQLIKHSMLLMMDSLLWLRRSAQQEAYTRLGFGSL